MRCLVRKSSVLRWLPIDDITLIEGDISTPGEELDRAVRGVGVVFHLAAVTSAANPDAYTNVNVEGTRHVVDAMRRAAPDALLVFCSSLSAAGPAMRRPVNETDEPSPLSGYGRSKLAAERIVETAGLQSLIIRPPAVYGPRDTDILAAFRLAKLGLAFRLTPPGQRLSLVYVEDLANGLLCAAEAEGRGLYYMTDGIIHTWESITEQVARAVERKLRVVPISLAVADTISQIERFRGAVIGSKPLLTPDRIRELSQLNWTCDDTRARLDIDYESSIALPDGIRITGQWYRDHGWLK